MKYASSHGTGISRGKHLAMRILGVGPAPVKWSSPQRNMLCPKGICFAFHGVNISRGKNLTGQGDEVIASTLTFIGSVTPIVFQGAMPVFIDSVRSMNYNVILNRMNFQ